MTNKIKFTKTMLDKLEPTDKQVILWDEKLTGFGLRLAPSGTKTFFVQARANGQLIKVTIGRYGDQWPAEKARKKATELVGQIAQGADPRAEKRTSDDAPTFGAMMTAYVELLTSKGKYSAKAVDNTIKKDIEAAHPKLWSKAANQIDIDDCVRIIKTLADQGKDRQADKLRSYIRAAFAEAINARNDAKSTMTKFKFNLSTNPARDVKPIHHSGEGKRPLELPEFKAYYKHVCELPEPARSIALLHLYTGGQRLAQLARVTLNDIDMTSLVMELRDPKGRRKSARSHSIPLIPDALECIQKLTGSGEYVFSCNGGISPINIKYMSDVVTAICDKMEASGELLKGRFTPGNIRATVETRLSDKPYSLKPHILGQLLSHGLGGVQNKNYNKHHYSEEKLAALEMLARMVKGQPEPIAEVIPFKTAV